MKKLLLKAAYLSSMGLVSCPFCLPADNNLILQPRIQSADRSSPSSSKEKVAPVQLRHPILQPPRSNEMLKLPSHLQPAAEIPTVQLQPSPNQQSITNHTDVGRSREALEWVKREASGTSATTPTRQPESSFTFQTGYVQERVATEIAKVNQLPPSVESPLSSDRTKLSTETIPARTIPAREVNRQDSLESTVDTVSGVNSKTRAQMASMISKKILQESSPTKHLTAIGSSMMGPAAVERELTEALARSEHLGSRGVFLSAREEAKSAQLRLARYLDSLSNEFHSESRLLAAQVALREAADFSRPGSYRIYQELISAHDTPVLKDVDVREVSPALLKQAYYQHAELALLDGSRQHPWFSDIFYTLGRTYQAEADRSFGDESDYLRAQAVVYYRAAISVRPSNALANNQLGYILLQLDRPLEAMQALIASVDIKLDTPALQNLVEASRRVGDQPMQHWALTQIDSINRRTPRSHHLNPTIVELDNSTFKATTPTVPYNTSSENRTASLPASNSR